MLGGVFKLTLLLHLLFLFVTLLWQVANVDASSILATDNNLAARNDDASLLLAGANQHNSPIAKRSPSLAADAVVLVEQPPARLRPRQRVFRKKLHPAKPAHLADAVPSAGARQTNHRSSKRIQSILDNRLKRFRMLDPEEFQEMLKSMSQHHSSEQATGPLHMDTMEGIQLENYWSRK